MAINLSGISLTSDVTGGGGVSGGVTSKMKYIPVTTLPSADTAKKNAVYLIPSKNATAKNKYDEYVVLQTENGYIWELFGQDVSVDLQSFATKTDLNKKQDKLVNQQNIRSINNVPLVGAGNVNFEVFATAAEHKKVIDFVNDAPNTYATSEMFKEMNNTVKGIKVNLGSLISNVGEVSNLDEEVADTNLVGAINKAAKLGGGGMSEETEEVIANALNELNEKVESLFPTNVPFVIINPTSSSVEFGIRRSGGNNSLNIKWAVVSDFKKGEPYRYDGVKYVREQICNKRFTLQPKQALLLCGDRGWGGNFCFDIQYFAPEFDGDIRALVGYKMESFCYSYMFSGCRGLVTAPELPAKTLANYCYYSMFIGCTSLVTAPELPATTLAGSCYSGMFSGCNGLVTAPELPATTLASYCYSRMFEGCTSLVTAPELPATTLESSCYSYMFSSCTSLVTAPELPATKMENSCYYYMFYGCSSLVTAPELPAKTLIYAYYCYSSMFKFCTSLVTAPELPAKTLAGSCYSGMFEGCTKLNYVKAMFINIAVQSSTRNWLSNVASSGTFVKNSAATWDVTGSDGIPSGWNVEYANS